MSRARFRTSEKPDDYESLGLEELAVLIERGDTDAERELRRRRVEEVRRIRTKYRFFVRFGKPGERSRIGLDTEFVVTSEGGLYDPHMAESGRSVSRWERGLSVYFAERLGGRAWVMREPDRRRASYQLGSGYLRHMLTGPLRPAVQAGEVYLVTGRLLLIDEEAGEDTPWGFESWGVRWPTYDVGSDGEPLVRGAKVVTRLDPFGDEPGVPKLLCCGYASGDTSYLKPLMTTLRLTREDFQDDEIEEEDEEDSAPRRNADTELRQAERRGDRPRVLAQRLRAGLVAPEHLAVAGWLGDQAAAEVVKPWTPAGPTTRPDLGPVWYALRHGLSRQGATAAMAAALMAARVIPLYERHKYAFVGDRRPREAVLSLLRWAGRPGDAAEADAIAEVAEAVYVAAARAAYHDAAAVGRAVSKAAAAAAAAARDDNGNAAALASNAAIDAVRAVGNAARDERGNVDDAEAAEREAQRLLLIAMLCGDPLPELPPPASR